MIKHIKKSLDLSTDVEQNIGTTDFQQLEALRLRLINHMGSSMGWHMSSIPMVGAIIFALFSFVMPQSTLWEAIFRLKGWPDYAILAAIFPTGIVYSSFIFLPAFFTARGLLIGLKSFLCVVLFTGLVAIAFFLFALISFITGAESDPGELIGAVLGLVFIAISIKCLDTVMCTKTIAFYLLNRVSRKQTAIQQQQFAPGKR
ncbi:hypothetical protein ACQYRI_12685 [Salmonella enterica]